MIYYVCSYGGCGSWMMCNFLTNLGHTAYHIHSRFPPKVLCKPFFDADGKPHEQFSSIPELEPAKVIYLYSKPEHSIASRASFGDVHWRNIGVHAQVIKQLGDISRDQLLAIPTDIIQYEQFFDNYVNTSYAYDIICINYHKIWDNIPDVLFHLDINPQYASSFPCINKQSFDRVLIKAPQFNSLNKKIDKLEPIFINSSV